MKPAIASLDHRSSWLGNPVLGLLVLIALLAALFLGFVSVAPNRILSGQTATVWVYVHGWLLAALGAEFVLLAAAAFVRPAGQWHLLAAVVAALALVTLVAAAGSAAKNAVSLTGNPGARISLGAAFWILLAVAGLALADVLHRLNAKPGMRFAILLGIAAAIGLLASSGCLDDLSLAREYVSRKDAFLAELRKHIALVLGALLPTLAIGGVLGMLILRRPSAAGPTFAILNIVQTIPSIALFGMLIEPLTGLSEAMPLLRELGLRGIGAAPAVIALVLYGLLPIVRSIHAGFTGVPAAVIDAAHGMGMTRLQILRDVEWPLALPVLLAGLRIVTIQMIGLTVVAALIGAGGLGSFVFQGLGQTATDLVLLGALAAIGLALFADGLLKGLTALVDRRTNR